MDARTPEGGRSSRRNILRTDESQEQPAQGTDSKSIDSQEIPD